MGARNVRPERCDPLQPPGADCHAVPGDPGHWTFRRVVEDDGFDDSLLCEACRQTMRVQRLTYALGYWKLVEKRAVTYLFQPLLDDWFERSLQPNASTCCRAGRERLRRLAEDAWQLVDPFVPLTVWSLRLAPSAFCGNRWGRLRYVFDDRGTCRAFRDAISASNVPSSWTPEEPLRSHLRRHHGVDAPARLRDALWLLFEFLGPTGDDGTPGALPLPAVLSLLNDLCCQPSAAAWCSAHVRVAGWIGAADPPHRRRGILVWLLAVLLRLRDASVDCFDPLRLVGYLQQAATASELRAAAGWRPRLRWADHRPLREYVRGSDGGRQLVDLLSE